MIKLDKKTMIEKIKQKLFNLNIKYSKDNI